MKKLSKTGQLLVDSHMKKNARELERALYDYYFHHEDVSCIIEPLKFYQNEDGGFGKGIEPDFWLRDSSPMATSIGLKYLRLVDHLVEGKEMIKRAVNYLENSYDEERKGWLCVPESVNDYPHAPWWTFDKDKNMTIIDQNWGNPSAELIGYLYLYKKYVEKLNVQEMIDQAIHHYNDSSDYESEHEVYCYIRLYNNIDKQNKIKLEAQLKHAINNLINPKMEEWVSYVPMPLNFVEEDSENLFDMKIKDITANLNFFVELLEEKEQIEPAWMWNDYLESWQEAKKQWTGILTLETMLKLRKFDRI